MKKIFYSFAIDYKFINGKLVIFEPIHIFASGLYQEIYKIGHFTWLENQAKEFCTKNNFKLSYYSLINHQSNPKISLIRSIASSTSTELYISENIDNSTRSQAYSIQSNSIILNAGIDNY